MRMFLTVVLAGLTAASVTWLLARGFLIANRSVALRHVPGPWRVFWPWLSAWAALLGRHLTWRQREVMTTWLQQAGMPSCMTPAHLCACGASAMMIGAGMGFWAGSQYASSPMAIYATVGGGMLALVWMISVLRGRIQRRGRQLEQALPFMLDMMTLCVESGLSLHSSLQHVVNHGPPGLLRDEIAYALAQMRAGVPRMVALRAMGDRCDNVAIRGWTSSMMLAEKAGASLGVFLREHSAHSRRQRLQRAEKLAMEAPVRLLLPLIACIFPCTFIVLAFPIVVHMWETL